MARALSRREIPARQAAASVPAKASRAARRQKPTEGAVADNRRLIMPSNESIAQFLGVTLGGALLGSRLASAAPAVGALLGALVGAGVVAFRMRHAH